MTRRILKLEVFKSPNGVVTVHTSPDGGGGTRLCGIKLSGSLSVKVAEFFLDTEAVTSLLDDFDSGAHIEHDAAKGAT